MHFPQGLARLRVLVGEIPRPRWGARLVIDDPDKPKPRITAEVGGQHQYKAVPDVDAELVKKARKKKQWVKR